MAKALTRWFIIVDCAKKRKTLARPDLSQAGANPKFLGDDADLANNVVNLTPRLAVEADMEHGLTVAEEVH